MFRSALILATTLCGLAACQNPEPSSADVPEPDYAQTPVQDSVALSELAEGVWMHSSTYTLPGGARVPSNGLVVRDSDGLILVDTAWGEAATQTLAKQLKEETGLDITKVVITHFHYDRLAGVDWLEAQGAQVFTHPKTAALSTRLGTPVPDTSVAALEPLGARTAIGPIEVGNPGPAHTEDNLIVYVRDGNILFGGCAVRAANHTGLGNMADANLDNWPNALKWMKLTYKDADIVVPSHGAPGNVGLLDHTLGLVARQVNATANADNANEPPSGN